MNIPAKHTLQLLLIAASFSSTPALAFECGNVGTGDDASQNDSLSFLRLACGHLANATGTDSTAVGAGANATGNNSTALGRSAHATGISGTAVGDSAEATGSSSTAIGRFANAFDDSSTSVGRSANATADRTTVIGRNASATAADNTTLGYDADALSPHTNATAIGSRAQVEQSNAMVLGSIPGLNSCDTTAGCNYVEIGMGTSTPAAALHIRRADGPLDASILIEDASTTTANRTLLSLVNNGNARIALENTANGARFELGTNANNGNFIFIADGEPIFTLTPNGRVLFGVASNPTLDVFPNGNGSFRGTVTATDYLMSSDVNEKQDIAEMPGNRVLAKLEQLPVTEWSYKKKPEERHIGPMAQDFKKAFNLGSDETKINPADMAGVNMAAIKALRQEKDAQIKALHDENAKLRKQLAENQQAMGARFAKLEAQLAAQQQAKGKTKE